jgi:hypothetical protein
VYSAGTFTATLDDQKTPFNQGVLVGLNDVLLGAIKVRATREDMKLYKLKLTANGNPSDAVASITLYDESGNPLSNPENVASGVFEIGPEDLLTNVVFPKDTYKTILVKGRVSKSLTSGSYYLSVANASDFQAVGVESEQSANVSVTPPLNLGNTTQGTFVFTDKVIEMKKNASSPSGSVSRNSVGVYAIWDVTNPTGNDISISTIKFTSKTGLPSGLVSGDASLFKLYDETGTQILNTTTTLNASAGTIQFEGSTAWTVRAGETKQLYLKIDTTSTNKWPSNTSMQWTVAASSDVTLSTGAKVGYAGTVWSIPADTNVVTLP